MKKIAIVAFALMLSASALAESKYNLVGDYDGDGKDDIVTYEYHRYDGNWHIITSLSNYSTQISFYWGVEDDIPVVIDFDHDGIKDPTVFRPSNRTYYILLSSCHLTCYTSRVLLEAL